MKLPLLALLVVAVAARHLRTDVSSVEQLQGKKSPAQDGETAAGAPGEAGAGAWMPPQEELEGGSGVEDGLEEEGEVASSSELVVGHKGIQCPKEEDTVKFMGSPGCKTCRFVVVTLAKPFNHAQVADVQSVCQKCYQGSLVSIHSSSFNFQVWCASRGLNAGQVWIGGQRVGWGRCQRFLWTDKSSWNFAYWALGQPFTRDPCVTMCTQGGHWRLTNCLQPLPYVCSY